MVHKNITPKVSVIIPVYGVEKYIERCARSLFDQTWYDIEYIFIDDCTPDNSIIILNNILLEYPKRKNQVHIFKMECNRGQAITRSVALNYVKGDYFIFVDSDDWLKQDAIEHLAMSAIANNADSVICDYNICDDLQTLKHIKIQPFDNMLMALLKGSINGSLFNKLFKTSLYKDHKFIPPIGNMGEDFVICLQFAAHSNKNCVLNETLYNYYFNSESICNKPGLDACVNKYKESIKNIPPIIEIAKQNGFYKESFPYLSTIAIAKRQWLSPFLMTNDIYMMWKNSTPEFVRPFLFSLKVPVKEKLVFIFNYLRIDILGIVNSIRNVVENL